MDEEKAFLEYLRGGDNTPPFFDDDLYMRLARSFSDPSASGLDRAVLLRQVIRRLSLRDGRDVPVEVAPVLAASIAPFFHRAGLRIRTDGMWTARPWLPEWLETSEAAPDGASIAGTEEGRRFPGAILRADPFFEKSTGYSTYRSPGQRTAARAIVTVPPGATLMAMLPTGSGKTEIALCLSDRSGGGLTVIVVPTVALAYDFERRFRDHFARRFAGRRRFNADALPFAWTATTDEATRMAIRTRIVNGQQPLLVTSPESMTRALRQTLLDAASVGRVKGFVVDEAHLVTQWGRFFRPEFRALADLRSDLMDRSAATGHDQPVTLLLSATLGNSEVSDLLTLFGTPGPANVVAANTLRNEPDIWIAPSKSISERDARVLETLANCPRPAILYVTSPDKAEEWATRLRAEGYSRIATVTGRSTPEQRSAVLQGIRADAHGVRALDLVVATSAFGLGIDYPHLRSVVHACIPETVDRWYQELGRAGRDGDICATYLLAAPGDDEEASSLGVRVLTPNTAEKRWSDLWSHRRDVSGRSFLDLEGARGSVGRGDYNRRWNAQVVQGLIELGVLKRLQFDLEDIRELTDTEDAEVSEWTAVEMVSAMLGSSTFWNVIWRDWQQRETARSGQSLLRIRDVAHLRLGACACIVEAYTPSEELKSEYGDELEFMEPLGDCGRCPDCRGRGAAPHFELPPSPTQSWAVINSDLTQLGAFAVTARGSHGCAIVTYGEGREDLIPEIAAGLARIGVRHFGGLEDAPTALSGEPVFLDSEPLSPRLDLSPVPTVSIHHAGQKASAHWLARRATDRTGSDGSGLIDILILPVGSRLGGHEVGRDIPALPAETARELLRSK